MVVIKNSFGQNIFAVYMTPTLRSLKIGNVFEKILLNTTTRQRLLVRIFYPWNGNVL